MSQNYENFRADRYGSEDDPRSQSESPSFRSGLPFNDEEFRSHLIVFTVINGILFLIDYLTGGRFWFQYVAISWGIGLSIHFWDTLFEATIRTPIKRELWVHAAVEGTLVSFFFLMDFFTSPRISWFVYPSLPLIFAWFCHYGGYRYRHPTSGTMDDEEWSSRYYLMMQREQARLGQEDTLRVRSLARQIVISKLSVGIHTVIYFAAVGCFLILDVATNPYRLWFYWPMLPWGLGYLIHCFGSHHFVQLQRGHRVSKWYNVVYPGSVCIFLFAIDALSGRGITWYYYPTIVIMGLTLFVIALCRQPQVRPIFAPIDKYLKKMTSNASPGQIEIEVTFDNLYEDEPGPSANTAPKTASPRSSRFCAKCGAPINANFKFCQYCGAKLRQN